MSLAGYPMGNPELLDYAINGGLFLLYDATTNEYQVTDTMIPWHQETWRNGIVGYLFRSNCRKSASEFFHNCLVDR